MPTHDEEQGRQKEPQEFVALKTQLLHLTLELKHLASLTADARHAQRHYFRTRSRTALQKAKAAERRLDKYLEDLHADDTLFPALPAP